jgi:hypothetical protein
MNNKVNQSSRVMESETILKNGAESKSLMSRGNFLRKACFSLLATGIIFSGCNDKEDNPTNVTTNTISAKWEILDSKSPYASFEFNKDGNYIVVENDVATKSSTKASIRNSLFKSNSIKIQRTSSSESNLSPIHFGNYKIEGNKIILSGFGLIEVISISQEEFSFSFTLEATGVKNSFVASKSAEPISTSSKTEMLCRTWILNKVVGDEEMSDEIAGSIVLFSKAGTYLVLYGGEGGEAGLSEWKWANKEETSIYYSWDNWQEDWQDNIVLIKELSSTTLKIQEDDLIYELTLSK